MRKASRVQADQSFDRTFSDHGEAEMRGFIFAIK
jgi:hypothetical protein